MHHAIENLMIELTFRQSIGIDNDADTTIRSPELDFPDQTTLNDLINSAVEAFTDEQNAPLDQ